MATSSPRSSSNARWRVVSGRDEIKLGLDGSSTTALMLDDVKVPVENVLGAIGQGHRVAFNILNLGRVKLGARNMSGVKLALGHAVKYAKERRQFGKTIAEFGLISRSSRAWRYAASSAMRCPIARWAKWTARSNRSIRATAPAC